MKEKNLFFLRLWLIPTSLLFMLSNSELYAQVAVPGSYFSSYTYLLHLKNNDLGDYSYNNSIYYNQDTLKWNKWPQLFQQKPLKNSIRWFNPLGKISVNTGYPRGYNDGPIWQGKGLTPQLNVGLQGNYGKFYFTAVPSVYYSQNLSFPLAPTKPGFNKYNYQFNTYGYIDYVQRYGSQPFISLNSGQSEIRYISKKFTVGVSTQNFTFGPAVYNPILMSKNAAGIPHIDIGTYSPVDVHIKGINLGKIEAKLYGGIMGRSAYHNNVSGDKKRYMAAMSINYQPSFVKGLKIGFNKVLYEDLKYFEAVDVISPIRVLNKAAKSDTLQNDLFDQMASLTVEWMFRPSNLRIYLDLAKNDFNGKIRNFLVDTNHSLAHTLGLQKAFDRANGNTLMFTYEHTILARDPSYLYRPTPPFYTHFIVKDGYTQNGQIMGAGIGPGSNSDIMDLSWYKPQGLFSLSMQRISFDNDYFITHYGFNVPPKFINSDKRDVEYTLGMKYAKITDRWMAGVNINLSYRLNWYYVYANDKLNVNAGVSFKYFIQKN